MRPFFYHADVGQNLFFFALFKSIILQFFTILQDKLHSFIIQDDQSTRFLCITNYSIDHIIKRFHEDNFIIPELFSQKNLVLCDMQGNIYGLPVKTIKEFPKSPFPPAGLTFDSMIHTRPIPKELGRHLVDSVPLTIEYIYHKSQ